LIRIDDRPRGELYCSAVATVLLRIGPSSHSRRIRFMNRARALFRVALCALFGMPAFAYAQGWTNVNPPAGAQVYYVAANGSDGNPGTQAAPFRTVRRGLQAARDGQPDQVLLRCGDTFTETGIDMTRSSGSTNSYFVIGSYGTGPRPKFLANDPVFLGSAQNRTGLAIVGLALEYTGSATNRTCMFFGEGWRHLLVEDCHISKWGDGIVMHSVSGSGRVTDVKIRRNIIVDIKDTDGRCQGLFFGEMDGLVIEGNVLDYNGRSTGEQTIFMHNVYIHETCGPAIFKDNISTRATSHGLQERPGGVVTNNFFSQNGINCYQGGNGGVANTLSYNVVIDGRNINSNDERGIAYEIGGHGTVEYNIAAHQTSGTGNITAFAFNGFSSGALRGNFVWDWKSPTGACFGTAVEWNGNLNSGTITVENNKFYQPNPGMLNRHETHPVSSQFVYRNNTYFTATPYGPTGCGGYAQFSTASGHGVDWNSWRTRETNSTFLGSAPGNPNLSVGAYMQSLGMSPTSLDGFLQQARQQSKQYWRPQFTAAAFNDWARARAGLPLLGGGAPTCYANCDGSAALNAADYVCFMNRFVAQDPWANCDGSTGNPVLNANDFQCFVTRYTTGCP
jgi:hypothetical protein